MPPKRKSRGAATASRGGKSKNAKRNKKVSTSEEERSASDGEDKNGFDKKSLQRYINFDFEELMNDPAYQHPEFVHRIDPSELTMDYFEKTGLEYPLHFRCDPKLLGMRLPDKSFSVDDVLELVGGNRIIEVVEVKNQGSVKMTLEEFINFYKTPAEKRENLYNVLSLEFSLTKMEDLVRSPSLVREIDWVGNKWPDALMQRYFVFGRDRKTYTPTHAFPKVQHYCLMSVANCYTDFHIDFSGTSVWYHVLKGRKVFWLIPPTETNFILYQEFTRSLGDLSFFGKSVEACHCAILEPGDTMLIPSGWIHAVYTPDDSLVFGGNFVHSMSCKMQLRVYQCENRLNITRKFRLPYNEELIFYVIADYVKQWTGREYARPLRIEDAKTDYVGKKWKAALGHHKKIDGETGVELPKNCTLNYTDDDNKDEVRVIAMHVENSSYRMPYRPSPVDGFLEAEEDEDDEKDQKDEPCEMDEEKRDAEIDELAATNPLIFYKNSKHDFVKNKSVPDHKLPIGYEPPIEFIQEKMDKISERLLDELEALGAYMRKKAKVEVAEGICQPASLLNAFQSVLKRRRAQLEGKEVEEKTTPKRKYTRGTVESGDFVASNHRESRSSIESMEECPRSSSRFEVQDFPDELLDNGEKLLVLTKQEPMDFEYVEENHEKQKEEEAKEEKVVVKKEEIGVTRRSSRVAANKASHAIKDEIEEEQKEEKTEDISWREKMELEEKEVKPIIEAPVEQPKKKVKLSREEKRELKEKELERKRKSSSLDAALHAAHGTSKSKKKKPEKPMYQGGLPVTPMTSNEPAATNPYNYNPMMEMVKLGTGQLKSAYRKAKTNLDVPFERKIYKMEPKRNSEENDEENNEEKKESEIPIKTESGQVKVKTEPVQVEVKTEPVYEVNTVKQPISIDIFDTPSSSSKKKKEKPPNSVHMRKPKIEPVDHISPSSSQKSGPSSMRKAEPSPNRKTEPSSSRKAEPSPMRKGVYMPSVSRQDKMIAEDVGVTSPSSRHSSFSERRPSGMIGTPRASNDLSPPAPIYTPTAPNRSSWIPDAFSPKQNSSHHASISDSPIDVVNDNLTPKETTSDSPSLHEITSPIGGLNRKDERNGKGDANRKSSDSSSISGIRRPSTTQKIPAPNAIRNLQALVIQLNQLNDSC